MQKFELTLDINELNFILDKLGSLPTHTGAYPLVMKIKEQAEGQMPKPETEQE
jgi:hypothetical protein